MEAGDTPGGEGRTDDVLGQEGEPHPALHHLAEQRGAAQLDVGMDRQPTGGEALVEGVTVAHAPLCEKKFLLSQNIQRHFGLVGQRMPAGATKQTGSGTLTASVRLGRSRGWSRV